MFLAHGYYPWWNRSCVKITKILHRNSQDKYIYQAKSVVKQVQKYKKVINKVAWWEYKY